MFTINIKKLRKQRYYIHHKSNKTNNGNEKHSKKDKSKNTTANSKAIIEYLHSRSVLI